jgi:hypothetical protein
MFVTVTIVLVAATVVVVTLDIWEPYARMFVYRFLERRRLR